MGSKIVMNDALKRFTFDQDKILNPEETVKRFKEKAQKTGLNILDEVKRIDNGRLDIPVYFSVCGHDAKKVIGTNKQMGKGATPHQAEASAVMELAERFSFFSFCNTPENFIIDKYKNVKDKAISFNMIAKSVHDESNELNVEKKIFEDIPLKWTRGYNITKQQEVLVPFTWFFAINEFNGPSAGNCVEEALSQGICEIVERHVSSIISHEKIRVSGINPDSASDKAVCEMLKKYNNVGIKLYISDFTLDMGIPSVSILAYDPSTFPGKSEIVWTAGTTPVPEKALSRALTETAQLAGDFNTFANYVASGLPKFTRLEDAEYVINPAKTINISDLPDLSNNNIKIEVENCINALEKRGMDVIVIDVMHKDLKIPSFYTIVPGAHFRERAIGTSVGMFSTKIITENYSPFEAILKLESINKSLPNKYYINFYLGTCHISMEEPDIALNYLNKALDFEPTEQDIPIIYSYMGVCYKDMQRYKEALDVLKKGKKIDKERTDIYNLMGFCYFKLKEHEKAIECFKRVIALNPSSAIDYANIASNYRDLGKYEKAIQYYLLSLELDPSIDFARENLDKLKSKIK